AGQAVANGGKAILAGQTEIQHPQQHSDDAEQHDARDAVKDGDNGGNRKLDGSYVKVDRSFCGHDWRCSWRERDVRLTKTTEPAIKAGLPSPERHGLSGRRPP